MNIDIHNEFEFRTLFAPKAAVTNDTAFVSNIIDLANVGACELVGVLGSVADTDVTFTVLLEHGNVSNLSDNAAVPDAEMLGTEAGGTPLLSDDNKTFKIGYRGMKRYVRLTVTPANNTGNIFLAGVAVLAHKRKGPQSTQVN